MPELKHSELWAEYWRTPDAIGPLIEAWMPLVHGLLHRILIRLPSHVPAEDLLQSAIIGLCHAIERFDPDKGAGFPPFAAPRIRGAVLDELRAGDHMSRSARSQLKKVQETIREWTNEHGVPPDIDDMDKIMGMASGTVSRLMERAHPWLSLDQETISSNAGQAVCLRDTIADIHSPAPDGAAEREDELEAFRSAFRQLKTREQKILYLYYFEDLNLREIGALFDVSEARICQIHALVIVKLRAIMQNHDG